MCYQLDLEPRTSYSGFACMQIVLNWYECVTAEGGFKQWPLSEVWWDPQINSGRIISSDKGTQIVYVDSFALPQDCLYGMLKEGCSCSEVVYLIKLYILCIVLTTGSWPGEGATYSSWCKQAVASELWDLSKPSSLRNRFYKLSRKKEGWQPAQAWHQYSKSAKAGPAPAAQQRAPAQLLTADPAENFCPSQPHIPTLRPPLVPRRRGQARTAFDCGNQTFSCW